MKVPIKLYYDFFDEYARFPNEEDVYTCEVCEIRNEFVRFEGETESFICDKCLYKLNKNQNGGLK
jgi:hypothetical protein